MLCVDNGAINGQGLNVDGGVGAVLMADLKRINPTVAGEAVRLLPRRGRPRDDGLPGRADRHGRLRRDRRGWGGARSSSRRWPTCSPRWTRPAGTPDGLASLTIYIVDMDDYRAHAREIGEVWRRLVGTDYPAIAGIGVTRLWDAEALVEVQGYAVL